MSDNKIENQELHSALNEVRELTKKIEEKQASSKGVAEDLFVQEKIISAIDKLEDLNQKNCEKLRNAEEGRKNFEKKVEELERKFYRMGEKPGAALPSEVEVAHKNAYDTFLRKGRVGMSAEDITKFIETKNLRAVFGAEELKYLRTDSNPDGGFLVPPEYVSEILKKITEVSPIRSYARVRQTSSNVIYMPTRTKLVSSSWEGEGITASTDTSKYGREELPMNRLTVKVPITREELEDAMFDMAAEISNDVAEEFARAEGEAFISGNSVRKPEGLMFNSDISTRNSGKASDLDFYSMLKVTGDIKSPYLDNSRFTFNRRTRATLMTLTDGVGRYLWQAGNIAAGVPSTVAGYEYFLSIDMDDIGANKYPILFGDFMRAYVIGDRTSMTVIRDDYTNAAENIVNFIFHKRLGGQVVMAEALVKIKCAV